MRTGCEKLIMKAGPYADNPQKTFRTIRQRVTDRLREGREIVRRVVVDEKNFIIFVSQYFRHAIQAESSALVEIIAVAIVPSVENDRYHGITRLCFAAAASESQSPIPGLISVIAAESFAASTTRHGSMTALGPAAAISRLR